jgi:hypothetical protein
VAVTICPSCQCPLTSDEARAGRCGSCGSILATGAAAAEAAMRAKTIFAYGVVTWVLLGGVAGLVAGGWLLSWVDAVLFGVLVGAVLGGVGGGTMAAYLQRKYPRFITVSIVLFAVTTILLIVARWVVWAATH